MSGGGETDPLALIIAAGASSITLLLGIVSAMLSSKLRRLETDVKDTAQTLNGSTGIFVRLTTVEGAALSHQREIDTIKSGTLSVKTFEMSIGDQNRRLEELHRQTKEVDEKVNDLNLNMRRSATPPGQPQPYPPTYKPR